MKRTLRRACIIAALCLLAPAHAAPAGTAPPAVDRVGFDPHPGLPLPTDAAFRDEAGRVLPLGRFFGRRPLVVIMAYYGCTDLCGLTIGSVIDGLRNAALRAGRDVDVLVVSIDPAETPAMALSGKHGYFSQAPAEGDGWHFLTGDEASIHRVAQAVGFRYYYDTAQRRYAHPAGIALATPSGRLSGYLPGLAYPPARLRAAVDAAAHERVGGLVERLLLLCLHYDPVDGRYTPWVMRGVRLAALAVTLLLAAYVLRLWRRGGTGRQGRAP